MTKTDLLRASALASALLLIPAAAFAQAAPAVPPAEQATSATDVAQGEPTEEGTIVVTGSRIARPEYSGVLPGVQIGAEQIATRGFTNAIDVLNDIPLVGVGANLNGNNGGQAASLGTAFADLLDLGTQRTLTLVNGRRFVSGNAASLFVDANATGGQVDTNVIPVALIDRIDVLTVGGAAAYGSEAIAGVINYILKDDFTGTQVTAISGITERGDGASYTGRYTTGMNFGPDDRGNIVLAAEANRIDGIQADQRNFRIGNQGSVTNFLNGGTRNSSFTAGIGNTAFRASGTDGVPGSVFLNNLGSAQVSPGGNIFNVISATGITGPVNQIGPAGAGFFAGTTQLVNGVPAGNGLNGRPAPATGLNFTTFAPTALVGANAAEQNANAQAILAQFAPGFATQGTQAQRNALAINLLQANRPTAREFLAANPNVPLNAFLGTFVTAFPDIANTNTTPMTIAGVTVPLNQVLPRIGIPLRFSDAGNVETFNVATLDPTTPGTVGGAPNGQGFNPIFNTVLRIQQERYIGNLIASYDLTDDITYFTENTYAYVLNSSRRNGASANTAASGTVENAALVVNVANPYLDAADRTALANAGIAGNFVLSRTNQDIAGDNPFSNTSRTFRLVNGLRADMEIGGRSANAEFSATYGNARQITQTTNLLDVEYALAVDTVQTPGGIRCRAQVTPAAFLGRTPPGISANLATLPGADGVPTQQIVTPTVTQAQIDACQPLNPFGFNQMSDLAKRYVTSDVTFNNKSTQLFLQGSFAGSVIDLPAGELGFAFAGEYRRETLRFASDQINQLGRSRTAPSAQTRGRIETLEGGAEARIPITGDDFTLPILGNIVIEPAVRFSKQDGSAPAFRDLQGDTIEQKSNGDWATIWSLAGTWQPVPDLLFRGNITRSIRQPGIVELFLGGQPAFVTPTDVCSNQNITGGPVPATRRANCIADVIAQGRATDATSAAAFLNTFVASGAAVQGTFAGSPTLTPERGRSKTFGVVFSPTIVPNFTASIDYISLDLRNAITPTNLAQAIQFCYDSATYPDTSPQFGSNTCGFFVRDANFQVTNGFNSGYLNLTATKVRAFNISSSYRFNLPGELGEFTLRGNAYHLRRFDESASGQFNDTQQSAGTYNRPEWKTQLVGRYEKESFFSQLTWNWRKKTRLFSGGVPADIELANLLVYPEASTFDFTTGANITDTMRVQFVAQNLTDNNYAGDLGFFNQQFLDQIGRRFQMTVGLSF